MKKHLPRLCLSLSSFGLRNSVNNKVSSDGLDVVFTSDKGTSPDVILFRVSVDTMEQNRKRYWISFTTYGLGLYDRIAQNNVWLLNAQTN